MHESGDSQHNEYWLQLTSSYECDAKQNKMKWNVCVLRNADGHKQDYECGTMAFVNANVKNSLSHL